MSYWDRPTGGVSTIDRTSIAGDASRKQASADAFYEIEPAIVLDIILDEEHQYFNQTPLKIVSDQWPVDVEGKPASDESDWDYTWMGRALVRLINSQRSIEKEDLVWALPLETNISEYPLLNEVVGVVQYLGQYYYTRKIGILNTPNANADFNNELIYGGWRKAPNEQIQGNRELLLTQTSKKENYKGPESVVAPQKKWGYSGMLGRYFLFNNRIRALKRREGDLVVESRFGQSIRFAAYDDDRNNDVGDTAYTDYYRSVPNLNGGKSGGGNPMIIIRNRQRPILKAGQPMKVYDNLPNVIGTDAEKNVGGYILEDVNNDGSSIHITSGLTISQFVTNCYKKLWGVGEEQSGFSGTTSFKYPTLKGDQIVVNSDRIIISAKKNEMFQFSKKRMAFVTDDEFTIDAHNQIVINTNNKTVINSPAIYLGEYDQTNEPVLLGQTSVNWLYDLCQWLLAHTHWYMHNHPDAQGGTTGGSQENKTQTTVQAASLIALREKLHLLMSRRVFVVGGGLANGLNGGSITGGASPVSITIPGGGGVPGGWKGANRR